MHRHLRYRATTSSELLAGSCSECRSLMPPTRWLFLRIRVSEDLVSRLRRLAKERLRLRVLFVSRSENGYQIREETHSAGPPAHAD
jgi:hypothetical protein